MATIKQSELIDQLVERTGLKKKDAAEYLNAFKDIIKADVTAGNDVALFEFGRFARTHRAARIGRNPQTGEKINIPATYTPTFKASGMFKKEVKDGATK